ncbi:unnamed protein product [Arabidopsis thaliana]|uniref:(thale cress) hypothetical protein n=1 Tax=Arabidopsis thaliana TaxID=3702 RepID=A0A7G2FMY9_ARATH|nr:unnamed protein product [Arabidopsis thaliana]
MEGNSFLFRIPNSLTRSRILTQRLWQIEGQTMFVAKWVPGVVPSKPELSSAPIWLELRNVPLQFFHEEGLERIVSLVGHPKCLHSSTASKTSLEVAKVLTIIDPRKPLPEAVNVQFDSGEVCRILVSSPWLPPVCLHCKEIGHSLRHCKAAPILCKDCSSTAHSVESCPKKQGSGAKKRRNQRSRRRSRTPASVLLDVKPESSKQGSVGREWKIKAGASLVIDKGKQIVGLLDPPSSSVSPAVEANNLIPDPPSPLLSAGVVSRTTSSAVSSPPSTDVSETAEDSSDILSSDSEEERFTKVFYKPIFGGVIETHVKQPKNQKFISELLPGWSFEENYSFSELGKIWVVWDPSVNVVIIAKSLQMITCDVLLPGASARVIISIVYAANEEVTRKELWKEIVDLGRNLGIVNKPWLMLGDFNQVLLPQEHSNPPSLNIDRRMRDFGSCLSEMELSDLVFKGNSFTWWNKSSIRPIAKKLDRILANDSWCNLYPSSHGLFGNLDFSDHVSCGVVLEANGISAKRPFKFFNFLLKNEDFLNVVMDNWFSTNVVGSSMYRVSKKLKAMKKPIKDFSRLNYSGIELRTKEAHELLIACQNLTLANPSVSNAALELEAQRKWVLLSCAEESFFHQRSRVSWFAEGDSNTHYFHRMVDSRKSFNTINSLVDSNGLLIDSQQGILDHCMLSRPV